jgi:exoribonuclease R
MKALPHVLAFRPWHRRYPLGHVVKVLGGLDEPVAEQEAVLLAAGVRTQDWTPQQLAELPPVNYQPTLQVTGGLFTLARPLKSPNK